MAITNIINSKPVLLGLKHFGFGLAGVVGILTLGAAITEIKGNPNDIGPLVDIGVPKYIAPAKKPQTGLVAEVTNTHAEAIGLRKILPFGETGTATIWNSSTLPSSSITAPILSKDTISPTDPVIRSVAEAASAPHSGSVNIINQGMASETGVNIIRPNIPMVGGGSPLVSAPITAVHSQGQNGLLPIIAPDGRTPFDVYKRPYTAQGPRVALVVGGLGMNARITERAINQLPAEVTLSFVPYADNLQGWVNRARAQGHEVLIEIPMEPFDYPENDTGPHTLTSNATSEDNQKKLEFLLSKTTGYFGVTNYLGGKFASSIGATTAMLRQIKSRGLGFITDGTAENLGNTALGLGLKTASAARVIDQRPSAGDISSQLGALEALATQKGKALGFGVGYSVTIDQIAIWAASAKARGISLAPASSIAE